MALRIVIAVNNSGFNPLAGFHGRESVELQPYPLFIQELKKKAGGGEPPGLAL
jgi:hypothetical protein